MVSDLMVTCTAEPATARVFACRDATRMPAATTHALSAADAGRQVPASDAVRMMSEHATPVAAPRHAEIPRLRMKREVTYIIK